MTAVTGKEQKGVCKVSEGHLHTPTTCTSLPSLNAAVLQLAVLLEWIVITVKSSPLLEGGINNH